MGRFDTAAAARYVRVIGVHATRECDTIVRMSAAPQENLRCALESVAPCGARFASSEDLEPHVWLEASMALESVLRGSIAYDSASSLLDAYQSTLEIATRNVDHEFFSHPLLSVLGIWVGEQDIMSRLGAVAPHPLLPFAAGSENSQARFCLVDVDGGKADSASAPSVMALSIVLVARSGSRQDEAALQTTKDAVSLRYGPRSVIVLRLGDVASTNPESLSAVATLLVSQSRYSLELKLKYVTAEAEKARKAVKSTFKSWFSGTSTPKTVLSTPTSLLSFASPAKPARVDLSNEDSVNRPLSVDGGDSHALRSQGSPVIPNPDANKTKGIPIASRLSRMMSNANASPYFAPESLEFMSRCAADLSMLSGDFEGAVDAYRVLATDLSGLSGVMLHEASAFEHIGIALALADGSKREVGTSFEKAIKLYAGAKRRELAVRVTLRAVDYCVDSGFPDSAAGILDRAVKIIFPTNMTGRSPVDSFNDAAAAMLLARTATMFMMMGRHRKCSMFSFLSVLKLTGQELHISAALVAQNVCTSALSWPGVRDEIELIKGRAEIAAGRPEFAMSHFSGVMSRAKEYMDLETQTRAIGGFFDATSACGVDLLSQRWDCGATFPVVDVAAAMIETFDTKTNFSSSSSGGSEVVQVDSFEQENILSSDSTSWRTLEDDVLEDCEYAESVKKAETEQSLTLQEKQSSHKLSSDPLRGDSFNQSGNRRDFMEVTMQRKRVRTPSSASRRRTRSLLDTGAVVGERVSIKLSLCNPLQFPVFIETIFAIAVLNEELHDKPRKSQALELNLSCNGISKISLSIVPSLDVVLMPCSTQDISLDVIVHRPGLLKFVGAKWFFSVGQLPAAHNANFTAPGYCRLDRRGKRLNATRKQRASDIPLYEEDMSLTVEVIPSAPRLVANLGLLDGHQLIEKENFKGGVRAQENVLHLRVGEMRKAILSIANEGIEKVESVMYRIDTPHLFFLETTDEMNLTRAAAHALDDHDALSNAGRLEIQLVPGEVVEKEAWIYAPWPGNHELRMILAYGSERPRVCRIRYAMLVTPSVKAFVRFLHCMSHPSPQGEYKHFKEDPCNELLLGIELEYAGSNSGDETYQIHSISAESKAGWELSRISEPRVPQGSEFAILSSKRCNLRVNETSTVFVVLDRPKMRVASDNEVQRTNSRPCVATGWPLVSSVSLKHDTHGQISDEHGEDEALSDHIALKLSRYFSLTSNYVGSRFPLHDDDIILFSLKWASSAGCAGQLHLYPTCLSTWIEKCLFHVKGKSELAEKQASSFMMRNGDAPCVRTRLLHVPELFYNFTESPELGMVGKPATMPVDVYFQNLTNRTVDIHISAPAAGGIGDGDRGRYWAGLVEATIRAIPPGLERRICLTAIFERPGSFNLANFNIEAKYNDSELQNSSNQAANLPLRHDAVSVALEPSFVVVNNIDAALAGSHTEVKILDMSNVVPLGLQARKVESELNSASATTNEKFNQRN